MFDYLSAPTLPGGMFGLFLLTLLSLFSILPLVVLVEYVVIQLLRWGKFRQTLGAAIKMNLVSFIVGLALMLMIPEPDTWQLLLFLGVAIVIETGILAMLKKGVLRENLVAAVLANGVSYIVLILPAFRFR